MSRTRKDRALTELEGAALGVVVGNFHPDLEKLQGLKRIYFAEGEYAAGTPKLKNIPDPIQVFRVILDDTSKESTAATEAMFRRPAVAVLPFENMGDDPEQEYFADGLTEDIITALSLWRSFPAA